MVIQASYLSFPVLQIALFMAVATAALPYLARGVQRLIELFIALVALASAVGGHGLPVNVLGSLAIGWGTTAVVRLIFGSPPACLRPVMCSCCWPSSASARRRAPEPEAGLGGSEVRGRRLGRGRFARCASGSRSTAVMPPTPRLLTKAGRFLLYRDSGPSLTITRLQQVEHEAFLTLRAGQAGVAVPEVVEAGTAGPSRDALLVYRSPAGTALSDADAADISDATLDDLYRQLLTLRRGADRARRDQR